MQMLGQQKCIKKQVEVGKKDNMYHIYKIENNINGKAYIGYTGKKYPNWRWSEHKSSARNEETPKQIIHKAIKKYGEENFTFEILYSGTDKKRILGEVEDKFIKKYDTLNNGYNMTKGGGGFTEHTPEMRKIMSEKKKGYTPWNKGLKGVQVAWNKGLSMDDPRVRANVEASHKKRRAEGNY